MGFKSGFTPRATKVPKIGGSGNALMSMMLAQSMYPEKKAVETEAKVAEETALAPLEREKAEAKKIGERIVETAPSRAVMKQTLVKAKKLVDQVQPQEPGMKRFTGGLQTWIKGKTQEIPQIAEYENMVGSGLTAFARTMFAEKGNVANWDIARVKKAFSDIVWDTADNRALSFNRAVDIYNDVMNSYQSIPKEELLDKREMLTPKEMGRSRYLSGEGDFADLTDEEVASITEDDISKVNPKRNQELLQELERRKQGGGL